MYLGDRALLSLAGTRETATAEPPPRPSPTPAPSSALPVELMQPAVERVASSGIRRVASRQAKSGGSTALDTGLFVSPSTVAAALPRGELVVTAECGGWLRVREAQGGLVRHQRRLEDGEEATALCALGRHHVLVGCLSGGLRLMEWVAEALVLRRDCPAADVAPIVQLVALASEGAGQRAVSLDTRGRLRTWCLPEDEAELREEGAALTDRRAVAVSAGYCVPCGCVVSHAVEGAAPAERAAACLLHWGTTRRWSLVRYYQLPAGAEEALHALCVVAAPEAAQLWAGTAGGALCAWELRTGRPLRRLALPSPSPVHAMATVGSGEAMSVWSCQMDGAVCAHSPTTFRCVQTLPVSYPPRAAEAAPERTVVRDAVDLQRALHDRGAQSNFTLFLVALEPVRMFRTWTGASDGTVRTWLIPAGRDTTAEGPPLDRQQVQKFLEVKAEAMVRLQAAHATEVAELQQRIEQLERERSHLQLSLQDMSSQYEARLPSPSLPPPCPAEDASVPASPAPPPPPPPPPASTVVASPPSAATPPPPPPAVAAPPSPDQTLPPPPQEAGSPAPNVIPSRVETLRQLLQDLEARVGDSLTDQNMLQEQVTAYRLRALDEAAAEDEVRLARRGTPPPLPIAPRPPSIPSPAHVVDEDTEEPVLESVEETPLTFVGAWTETETEGPRSISPLRPQPAYRSVSSLPYGR